MAVEGKNDDLRLSVTVNSEWPERERREEGGGRGRVVKSKNAEHRGLELWSDLGDNLRALSSSLSDAPQPVPGWCIFYIVRCDDIVR